MDFEYFCQEMFNDISEDLYDKDYEDLTLDEKLKVVDIACDAIDP